jgi:CBS domain-containing protein
LRPAARECHRDPFVRGAVQQIDTARTSSHLPCIVATGDVCMSVRAILNEKGRNVVIVTPQVTVQEAATFLHDNHIGAVVIVDPDDHILGILTERDIVASIAKYGATCLDKPVSSAMWQNVYCCREEMSVQTLMEMMSKLRARHLPVERDGRLAGIISIGDVVKYHIRAMERETEEIKAYIAG